MSELSPLGKILIFLGLVLILLGVILILVGKIPFIGKLPGDIYIRRKNFNFYFPLTTCILFSIIISFILWLVTRR